MIFKKERRIFGVIIFILVGVLLYSDEIGLHSIMLFLTEIFTAIFIFNFIILSTDLAVLFGLAVKIANKTYSVKEVRNACKDLFGEEYDVFITRNYLYVIRPDVLTTTMLHYYNQTGFSNLNSDEKKWSLTRTEDKVILFVQNK